MTKVVELTDDNFELVVFPDNRTTLVYFWAPWCGPCRALGPIITELAFRYDGQITFGKMNADENPVTVQQYAVYGLPTIHIYKDGLIQQSFTGAQSRLKLIKILDELLN